MSPPVPNRVNGTIESFWTKSSWCKWSVLKAQLFKCYLLVFVFVEINSKKIICPLRQWLRVFKRFRLGVQLGFLGNYVAGFLGHWRVCLKVQTLKNRENNKGVNKSVYRRLKTKRYGFSKNRLRWQNLKMYFQYHPIFIKIKVS